LAEWLRFFRYKKGFSIHGWWNEGSIFDRYILKRPISIALTFAATHLSAF
jgi:hypothetical protein